MIKSVALVRERKESSVSRTSSVLVTRLGTCIQNDVPPPAPAGLVRFSPGLGLQRPANLVWVETGPENINIADTTRNYMFNQQTAICVKSGL